MLRKAWQRWRYAAAAKLQVLAPQQRPQNVTWALCEVASEIAASKGREVRRVERPRETPVESHHLTFLRQVRAAFGAHARPFLCYVQFQFLSISI